jgi:hypothetical protein
MYVSSLVLLSWGDNMECQLRFGCSCLRSGTFFNPEAANPVPRLLGNVRVPDKVHSWILQYILSCLLFQSTLELFSSNDRSWSLELTNYQLCRLLPEPTSRSGHSGTRTRAQGRRACKLKFLWIVTDRFIHLLYILPEPDHMSFSFLTRDVLLAAFRGRTPSGSRARRRRHGKSTRTLARVGSGGGEETPLLPPPPPPRRS